MGEGKGGVGGWRGSGEGCGGGVGGGRWEVGRGWGGKVVARSSLKTMTDQKKMKRLGGESTIPRTWVDRRFLEQALCLLICGEAVCSDVCVCGRNV